MVLSENPDLTEKAIVHDKEHTGDSPGERITEGHGIDIRSFGYGQYDPQNTDHADAA